MLNIKYPYEIRLDSKLEAISALINMCSNCDNKLNCSKENQRLCKMVKKDIAKMYKLC